MTLLFSGSDFSLGFVLSGSQTSLWWCGLAGVDGNPPRCVEPVWLLCLLLNFGFVLIYNLIIPEDGRFPLESGSSSCCLGMFSLPLSPLSCLLGISVNMCEKSSTQSQVATTVYVLRTCLLGFIPHSDSLTLFWSDRKKRLFLAFSYLFAGRNTCCVNLPLVTAYWMTCSNTKI